MNDTIQLTGALSPREKDYRRGKLDTLIELRRDVIKLKDGVYDLDPEDVSGYDVALDHFLIMIGLKMMQA